MTSPLHVAYLAPSWPPGTGRPNGIVTALAHTVPAMIARGHRVTVLTQTLHGTAGRGALGEQVRAVETSPVSVIDRVRSRASGPVRRYELAVNRRSNALADALSMVHEADPIDVVEIEESHGLAAAAQRRLSAPVIVRLHGPVQAAAEAMSETMDDVTKARAGRERAVALAAVGVTAPAASTLSYYEGYAGLTETIPNPMPVQAKLEGGEAVRRGHVAFIGRIDRRKGADIAVRASALAMTQDDDLRLFLCGAEDGIDVPGEGRLSFEAFLARFVEERFHDRFEYLGVLPGDEVSALRRGAGVVLMTSRYENFPYSVAKAMSEGKAIVAADTFGVGEIIEDGESGILVPPADVEATAEALVRLVTNEALAERLGANAARRAADVLAPSVIAAQTERFYRRVMERAP